MAGRVSIVTTVALLAAPLCTEAGLFLVDAGLVHERGRNILRLVIDRPGGIRLEDLEQLHRRLGRELDAAEPSAGNYDLELSSPGLDRQLRNDHEFDLFRGREVELRTYGPIEGRREWIGVLDGLREGEVVLIGPAGECWRVPRAQLAKARLHPRL